MQSVLSNTEMFSKAFNCQSDKNTAQVFNKLVEGTAPEDFQQNIPFVTMY